MASRIGRKMRSLGYVNVAKRGTPAIWVPKADVEAAPEAAPLPKRSKKPVVYAVGGDDDSDEDYEG